MNTILAFMKKNYKIILLLLAVSAALWSFMPKKASSDPEKDQLLLELITYLMERTHYDPAKIDDAFSQKVYTEYIKGLDPMKRYFLQSDIDEFAKYEFLIDDMIELKELSFFDLTYERITKRMDETKAIYKDILKEPFDFTIQEDFNADYDSIPYAKNEIELKDRWKRQLKLNVLSSVSDNLKIQEGKDVVDSEEEEFDELGNPVEKTKKKKDEAPKEIKSFEQLEKEARESTEKSLDEYFDVLGDLERKDWFSIYLNCIIERFDPHSFYFAPEDKEKFDASMSGSIEGIGAVLRKKTDGVEISELVPGGPAWRGKEIEVGDVILKVAQKANEDPVDVVGMRLDNVVKQIKGKKGTTVYLTIKKIDGTIKTVAITREIIEFEETYAKSSVIQDGDRKYGIIQLPKFYIDFENKDKRNAFTDVAKEIKELKSQNVDGIIMDLRNNGGGSLSTVVDMVGLFVKEGPVVQVKSSRGKQQVLDDKGTPIVWDGPLVVLVNNFSASASEIFAAAIQDYNRGVIMGSKHTYGKGTVQNLIDLNELLKKTPYGDLGALKITLQKFYRINGGSTQREGVLSDIILPDRYSYIDMGERDMDNAMPWDKIDRANYLPYDYNFKPAQENSKKRISNNEQFKLIDENAKWISERKDEKVFPLNFEAYQIKQKEVEEKSKKFKVISKYNNKLSFTSLPSEILRVKTDTILESKRDRWHESLNADVYIEEGVNVLQDLSTAKATTKTIKVKPKTIDSH